MEDDGTIYKYKKCKVCNSVLFETMAGPPWCPKCSKVPLASVSMYPMIDYERTKSKNGR
jgi:uncharacterized Zn finger protein (UPF0148 family)